MHIGNVSFLAANTPLLNPAVASKSTPTAATTALPELEKPSVSSGAANTAIKGPAQPIPVSSVRAGGAGAYALTAQSAAAEAELTSVSAYATTLNGKLYAGSVEDAGGQYTASIPSVARATATASNAATAETNLDIRIDELV
jgi:hypothetical protein